MIFPDTKENFIFTDLHNFVAKQKQTPKTLEFTFKQLEHYVFDLCPIPEMGIGIPVTPKPDVRLQKYHYNGIPINLID